MSRGGAAAAAATRWSRSCNPYCMPSIPTAAPARNTNSSVEAILGFTMEGLLLTVGDQIYENSVLVGCACHQPRLGIV